VSHYPSTRQLECLVAVADTLNFRRAATRLNLSHPPLSRHIKALEYLVGVQLFIRDTHSVYLTEAGTVLAQRARKILADMHQGVLDTRNAGDSPAGIIKLGITRVLNPSLFPNIEQALLTHSIEASVYENHDTSRRLTEQVISGRLDMAVVAAQPKLPSGIRAKALFSESLLAVVSSDMKLPEARLSFQDIPDAPLFWFKRPDNPLLYDLAEHVFQEHAFQPQFRPKPNYREALYAKIAAGEGVAFLPNSLASVPRSGIVFRRFNSMIESELKLSVELIRRTDNAHVHLDACEDIFSSIAPQTDATPRIEARRDVDSAPAHAPAKTFGLHPTVPVL